MYLICGEALFDLVTDDRNADAGSWQLTARAGGSPFNVSIGISRLGKKAALLTAISTDRPGQRLVEVLQREGVSTKYLLRSDRRTTLSLVSLDDSGTPEYAFYGEGSADCSVQIADLPAIKKDVSALHFGSYSVVVNPVAGAFASLLDLHKSRLVSFDPNVRPNIEADMDIWRERIQQYRNYADLLKVSTEDLNYLYPGIPGEKIASDWLDSGVGLVVVTDGQNGCIAWSKTGVRLSRPALTGIVADTVGAGDSFQAALLAGLADYENPKQAVQLLDSKALEELITRALAAASITCSRVGANLPTAAEVQARIDA